MVLPLWAQENAIECVLLGVVVKLSKDLVLHLVLQPRLLKAKCAIASQPGRINKNNLCPDSGLTLAKVVKICERIPNDYSLRYSNSGFGRISVQTFPPIATIFTIFQQRFQTPHAWGIHFRALYDSTKKAAIACSLPCHTLCVFSYLSMI